MLNTRMLFAGLLVAALALALAVWIGSGRQQREWSSRVDRLMHAVGAKAVVVSHVERRDEAPAPVERYLRRALPGNQTIQVVRIRQVGRLRTDLHSGRWMPFEAQHIVVPPATGFVWNARVGIAPLLHVRVHDALIDGQGSGHVSLLSVFSVNGDSGTPEMNAGALHRYLAEAVWYPSALIPSDTLRWSAMDANRALATLTAHGVSVSLEFRFADTSEVSGIYTPARWGRFDGGYKQVPWEGHFRNYQEKGGLFVPRQGEVGWYSGKDWQPVWEGEITSYEADSSDRR